MSAKKQLQQSVYTKLKRNKEGSYTTQRDRARILTQMCEILVIQGGYRLKHIDGLKTKHIHYLVNYYQQQGISTATIKNRMAAIRWICEKINKKFIVHSNDALGIEKRKYKTNQNKAIPVTDKQLSQISCPYVKFSLGLQERFGLRREESIKFNPFIADKGNSIFLKKSWCKGGRSREIPITTTEQREYLEKIKQFLKNPNLSLIPEDKTYKTQKSLYEKQLQRAGIHKSHGLRHRYAQMTYKKITGWDCPACGGSKQKNLNPEQKILDKQARLEIAELLGHSREYISAIYIGK
ncbi:MAG: phage integrase N-terminal domain-containing protein [Gammaproteobacteria bacterium]